MHFYQTGFDPFILLVVQNFEITAWTNYIMRYRFKCISSFNFFMSRICRSSSAHRLISTGSDKWSDIFRNVFSLNNRILNLNFVIFVLPQQTVVQYSLFEIFLYFTDKLFHWQYEISSIIKDKYVASSSQGNHTGQLHFCN